MQCPLCLEHYDRKEFARTGPGRRRWSKLCRVCELEQELARVRAERERHRQEILAMAQEHNRRYLPDD